MARDHFLMLALCGIVLINVIAIVLLNNQLAAREVAAKPVEQPVAAAPVRTQASVRTLLITDHKACPDCYDIHGYVDQLSDTILMDVDEVDAHNVPTLVTDVLPVIAFNSTIEEYPTLVDGWDVAGTIVNVTDGPYAGKWYVLPTQNAPSYSTVRKKVSGRVTVTYLTMASCTDCYDVHLNRQYLNDSRITPYREIDIDAASPSGKQLIELYNITALPTILLDKEADAYTNLAPGWSVVGTQESDGTYVLRNLQRLGVTYYDSGRKKLMKP